tara:strand:- start:443 stop:793 length:351 start_codon:yes stop_codon:yes gene_type:complete
LPTILDIYRSSLEIKDMLSLHSILSLNPEERTPARHFLFEAPEMMDLHWPPHTVHFLSRITEADALALQRESLPIMALVVSTMTLPSTCCAGKPQTVPWLLVMMGRLCSGPARRLL